MEVIKAKDIVMQFLSWLIYGRSRAGKTTLIGTFPAPILLVDFANENGSVSLRGHSSVTVLKVASKKDMDEAVQHMLTETPKVGYKTVAIDSLTSLVELLKTECVAKTGKPPQLQDWGAWGNYIIGIIDRLRVLPCEKVYTATATVVKDAVDGSTYGGPDLFASLENRVPAKTDATIYMEARADLQGVVTRKAHLAPAGGMIAGVRGCLTASFVEQPDYGKIMACMTKPLFD